MWGIIHTEKPEEGRHFLPLDDDGRGHGHFGPVDLDPTRAQLALARRARGLLAVGPLETEASSPGLGRVRAAGFHHSGRRGGGLAPAARELYHAVRFGSRVAGGHGASCEDTEWRVTRLNN